MSFPRIPLTPFLCLLALPTFVSAQPPPPKGGAPADTAPKAGRAADALPPGAVARLGSTRFRHSGGVRFIGYAGDGGLLLTADAKALRFWDARTGKETRTLVIASRPSRGFPFQAGAPAVLSGDGKTVVTGFDTGECAVIEVATGKELRKFKTEVPQNNNFPGSSSPTTILSHDGRLLLAAEGDNNFGPGGGSSKIRIWDTTTGKQLRELTPKDKGSAFTATAFSRDGKILLTAEGPNPNMKAGGGNVPASRLRYLNPQTGNELQSFTPPTNSITLLRPSPDGKTLAVAAQDGQGIRLLETATSKERTRLQVKQGQPHEILFSPDGKMLFAVVGNEVTQWDLLTGKELRHFPIGSDEGNRGFAMAFGRTEAPPVALSPGGRTLALPTPAAVVLWDTQTGKELPGGEGHRNRIAFVTFGPGGKEILTGSADGALYLWDVATGRRLREFTVKTPGPGPGRMGMEMFNVLHVSGRFAPDGKSIAGLWPGGKVQVWDTAGKLRFELGDARGHTSFAYSPDGRYLAANGSGGSVHLWDAATGRPVRQFSWMPKDVQAGPAGGMQMEQGAYSAAFSPDGRVLLSGAMLIQGNGLRVLVQGWEMASGKERLRYDTSMTFDNGGPQSLDAIFRALDSFIVAFVFSPNGRLVAEASFSSIRLRDLARGEELRLFGGREVTPSTTVFSPDGKLLLAGQQDGTIRLWDVATATVLMDLPAHRSAVTALAFSPDGKLLASGARDTTLLLWDWAQVRRHAAAPKAAPAPAAREALWADLAADDAPRAYEAIKSLAASPAETLALLKSRLQTITPIDPARMDKLLADLDHKQFAKRQQAEKELAQMGDVAAKAIKDRLAGTPTLEMKTRLGQLLERIEGGAVPPEVVRAMRAIEVLERIDTGAARKVLERLARGAPGHRVTAEARSTLARLSKQSP